MKYKLLLECVIILLISYLISLTKVSDVVNLYIELFNPIIYIFITILVFYYFVKTIINKSNLRILIISYLLFLIIMLFLRKQQNQEIEFDFYLLKWLKLLFKNKTIFINVFGNILIFIPFGYIMKNILKSQLLILLISLITLVLIEFIQYILLVGVFDIVDIILNFIGILIGFVQEGNVHGKKSI